MRKDVIDERGAITAESLSAGENEILFRAWCQTSNATDMSAMYPYANYNTLPAHDLYHEMSNCQRPRRSGRVSAAPR